MAEIRCRIPDDGQQLNLYTFTLKEHLLRKKHSQPHDKAQTIMRSGGSSETNATRECAAKRSNCLCPMTKQSPVAEIDCCLHALGHQQRIVKDHLSGLQSASEFCCGSAGITVSSSREHVNYVYCWLSNGPAEWLRFGDIGPPSLSSEEDHRAEVTRCR